jgi:hypothetical protein
MNIDESLTAKGFTPAAYVPQVYGRPRTIESITIHWWGAYGQTHEGVVNFFVNGPGQTSAHFVASEGKVHCLVSPLDAAWHAGNPVGNATSIGIECRPEGTDGDYQTISELIRWLREQYGDLPLIPHRDWQSTACPGTYDLARLDAMARSLPAAAPATAPAPKEDDDMVTITLMDDGNGKLYATSDFITKWHVPDPSWITHYRNIEKYGFIKLRRDSKGNDILKMPAFGAEVEK